MGDRMAFRRRMSAVGIAVALCLGAALVEPAAARYLRPGRTSIVSVTTDGTQGTALPSTSLTPTCAHTWYCMSDISANGRYVAFESPLLGLVPGDTNLVQDIFVKDLQTGAIERVSVADDGTEAFGFCVEQQGQPVPSAVGGSWHPSISSDGRFVTFSSCAVNLSPIDDKTTEDIFVHDRETGNTELVSMSTDGEPALCVSLLSGCNRLVTNQSISANGRYVVFESSATNLVSDDTNGAADVFIRDLKVHTTERVSVDAQGKQVGWPVEWTIAVEWGSYAPAMSEDGRYVAFQSDAPNLVENAPDDPLTDRVDVFVKDLKTGSVEQIDITKDGREEVVSTTHLNGNDQLGVGISGDGRFVAFPSRWEGFVPNDANDAYDVFVKDRTSGRFERASVGSEGTEPDSYSSGHIALSRDGRFVSFMGNARLVPEDSEGAPCGSATSIREAVCTPLGSVDMDVYVYDRAIGAVDLVSWTFGGMRGCQDDASGRSTCSNGTPGWPSLDATGRYVAFSGKLNHTADDVNDAIDTFVRDRGSVLSAVTANDVTNPGSPGTSKLCIAADLCIPPGGSVSEADAPRDVSALQTSAGADLRAASLAYRPQYADLLARIELEEMPHLDLGVPAALSTAGSPALVYGLQFHVGARAFEVRASSWRGGTFGLFDCTASATCKKIADLHGGYGTTGMRIDIALPLGSIGTDDAHHLTAVKAFSAFGTRTAGPMKILDRVTIR